MAEQPILTVLDEVGAALIDHDLPQVWSLSVGTDHRVVMQIRAGDDTTQSLAGALMQWAHLIMGDVTCEVWRTPESGWVHLDVQGRWPQGIIVTVFGATSIVAGGFGSDLAPGQKITVSIEYLRDLAGGAA